MMKKIGFLSGTFDPVHNGHLAFARQAIQEHGLDKVVFLVEPEPRRKHTAMAYKHRLVMVELAVSDEPNMEVLTLDQPRFTVKTTLPILEAKFAKAKLYLLVGDDILEHMTDWQSISSFLKSVKLIIAARTDDPDVIVDSLRRLQGDTARSINYLFVENKAKSVSSRAIRQALKQHSPADGLPEAVHEYIEKHKLYL